ncbi:MAG: hypothetical protein J4215_05390 [Candidatus Diapherotrites archaeon]|uniref:Uncharacterized protein n=1 Tax=Candidatus Iainarchaeum sp. TaxID=3101447 RepID=A0A8T4L3T9_9ARCH|nr:hypothetical protein [Candidatus Diapherotrites archaeon]
MRINPQPGFTANPLRKKRKCLNCAKDIVDDNSVAFLRGFCSDKCRNEYME